MAEPAHLMISAGEASGEHHVARVLHALHAQGVTTRTAGMGGPDLAAAGMEILVDCRDMAIVGIVEVIRHWGRIQRNLARLRCHLRDERPDLLILVDYPEFNLKLAETARELGIPVLYYISPQIWAWRPGRMRRIAGLVDMMAVLFPFEEELYARAGVPVRYVGHPLVDEVAPSLAPETARAAFNVAPGETVIGLLPGSRHGEITRLLPTLLDSAREIERLRGSTRFLLPVASTLDATAIQSMVDAHGAPVEVVPGGRAHDVMQICDSVIAASGTVTLEAALLRVPMTVVYRVHWLTYLILRRLVTIDMISLVNIVAQRRVVHEFIQARAEPWRIARETLRTLDEPAYRQQMLIDLDEVRGLLGDGGAPERTAQLVREMLAQTRRNSESSQN